MARSFILFAIFHAYLVALATAASGYSIKDHHRPPRGWYRVGRAPADHLLKLKIDLTHRDFPGLERQLYEAANPHHFRYGQYLSLARIHDLASPEGETIESVEE
jgi:tripeptidyl-peptidase I